MFEGCYDFVIYGKKKCFQCSNKIHTPTDMKLLSDVSKIELVVSWGGKRGTELQGHKEGMKNIIHVERGGTRETEGGYIGEIGVLKCMMSEVDCSVWEVN